MYLVTSLENKFRINEVACALPSKGAQLKQVRDSKRLENYIPPSS